MVDHVAGRVTPARRGYPPDVRDEIRQAGADDARRSRAGQGFPERIEDPAAIAVLAALLRDRTVRVHVHDDTFNCLACYYGEADQFSPPSGR